MTRTVDGLDPLPKELPEQVLAKLARADAHIIQVVEAVLAWREANQKRVVEQTNRDGSEKRLYLSKYESFPPRLPLVIGDALFGLRCALDHLIFDLHRRKFGEEFTPKLQRDSMFPIVSSPEAWASNGRRRVKELGPEVEALVESLQPHRKPTIDPRNPPTARDRLNVQLKTDWRQGVQRWLGALDTLHNVDKHRSLHVLAHGSITAPHPRYPVPAGVQILPGDGTLDDGAYLGKVVIADPRRPEMQVGMARRFTLELVHGADEYDVPVDLLNLSNATKATLKRFIPYLVRPWGTWE